MHRQGSPESRDWLAKLMGTTAIWQSTDQTAGHGALHTGSGSRRRVREFRVSSDTFAELRTGEAIIHTTLGPKPAKVTVDALALPHDRATPRLPEHARGECEIDVHPARELPPAPNETAPKPQAPAATARKRTTPSSSKAPAATPAGQSRGTRAKARRPPVARQSDTTRESDTTAAQSSTSLADETPANGHTDVWGDSQ